MKPVLVLQHLVNDGPAFLGTWLQTQGVAMDLRCTEAGDAFPEHLDDHRAVAILGGAMSANDDLPSLRQAERLFLLALRDGIPTVGHCLGGQLMARALGARVDDSPAPEVGWQSLVVQDNDAARSWFGQARQHTVFQWHYEAFALPAGAIRLAGNVACPNQAFALGPHLGMQFHVEIDDRKLMAWVNDLDDGYAPAKRRSPNTVQSAEAMREGVIPHLREHLALADHIYRRWLGAAA